MDFEIKQGDVLHRLARMRPASVQTCVTSPPYFGLRDYGTAEWVGGRADCEHIKGTVASVKSTLRNDGREKIGSGPYEHAVIVPYREVCGKCGARRVDAQIGLEHTPAEYVARMVDVFRAVRRVLADDGTLWLNLGDSYGNKQLLGIPWRVALALQADGWVLRSDIIWAKPNPMPESIRDRPTKAHEYLFLLAKSERYLYDAAAVREPVTSDRAPSRKANRNGAGMVELKRGSHYDGTGTHRNRRTVWTITPKPYAGAHFAVMPEKLVEPCVLAASRPGDRVLDPFAGSGTVGVVSIRHGRRFVGIELNPAYCELAEQRLAS